MFIWDAFGEDRLIYGSNWPVSERFTPYKVVQQIVNDYFSAKGEAVKAKFFLAECQGSVSTIAVMAIGYRLSERSRLWQVRTPLPTTRSTDS